MLISDAVSAISAIPIKRKITMTIKSPEPDILELVTSLHHSNIPAPSLLYSPLQRRLYLFHHLVAEQTATLRLEVHISGLRLKLGHSGKNVGV